VLKNSTCSEVGIVLYICSCGDKYTKDIPKIAHIVVVDKGYAATCLKSGKTDGSHCKVCNTVITEPKTITIKKHIFTYKTQKATYFANGYKRTVCVNCKLTLGNEIEAKLVLSVPEFKLTKGKKQFKVKYTKVVDATGFQVRYKLKGKWKVKTFNSKKTATKLIKKLKKGTYQVQIRAMVVSGSKKAYSAWSKTRKVKVK